MARTPSNMLALGSRASDFTLLDTVTSSELSLSSIRGAKGTVLFFICNHCPFVIHVNDELVRIANDYDTRGIGFAAISSNDVENYPDDHPDLMKVQARKLD